MPSPYTCPRPRPSARFAPRAIAIDYARPGALIRQERSMRQRFPVLLAVLAVVAAALTAAPQPAHAEQAAAIETSSRDALALLKQNSPAAAKLAPEAAAILVFPTLVPGGLILGGQSIGSASTRERGCQYG